ncbi:T9SS type A sorting domain-containing protein [Bacteroidota bacterium]
MRYFTHIGSLSYFALLLIFANTNSYCQYQYGSSRIINKKDSVYLSNLPEKTLSNITRATILPYEVDNSKYKYFRDVIDQQDPSCGQHASVVYTFTYEINRLRNLASDIPENQYPSHFPFNFMNGGYGWLGVSIHHSFEILKKVGCPTVADFGGVASDPSAWMNGYGKYYNAMSNRIKDVYQIKVGTESGLITLKNWLHNHLEGDSVGGIACFYANSPWNLTKLDEGTPEEGKYVIADWGGPATHGMAIVGYNDSIRYDYNGDGKYTNDIDLNNDGIINLQDWEIGGVKFVDGFYDGVDFADSGFCYMMYRNLAISYDAWGIWNNLVFVIDADESHKPELTAKVTLKHDSRDKISINMGVSNTINAINPDAVINFPVFNFQGGPQYMQGGNTIETHKTIELGLDISELLNYIEPGIPAEFFLQVIERDPYNVGSGEIIDFEIYRYADIITSASCTSTPLVISNNKTNSAKVTFNPGDYNKLRILEDNLPEGIINQPYSVQLHGSGGQPEYKWKILQEYDMHSGYSNLPVINEYNVTPYNQTEGIFEIPLHFEFPFYGKLYDTIYIHTDGFIMFDNTRDPWPYMHDEQLMIRSTKCIAPLNFLSFETIPSNGQGIWMTPDTNNIGVKWIVSSGFPETDNIEFSCRLFKDGNIQFFYNNNLLPDNIIWSFGISNGDMVNHEEAYLHEVGYFSNDFFIQFSGNELPESLDISEDGLLTAVFSEKYIEKELVVMLTDQQNVFQKKSFDLFTYYFGTDETEKESYDHIKVYPNPFSEDLSISTTMPFEDYAIISIFDIHGKKIAELYNGYIHSGSLRVTWNGKSSSGLNCKPGVYILKTTTSKKVFTNKIIKH